MKAVLLALLLALLPSIAIPATGYQMTVTADFNVVGSFGIICNDAPGYCNADMQFHWTAGSGTFVWGTFPTESECNGADPGHFLAGITFQKLPLTYKIVSRTCSLI
jgi:hypothetical protein